jgi:hypothetical protein
MVTRKELAKIFNVKNMGWRTLESFSEKDRQIVLNELKCNTGRVGIYVYHSHEMVNGKLEFKGVKVGYYLRSRNPFSWRFHRTHGNH